VPDKYITINLIIKDDENKEEIKKIIEEVLEERAKQCMHMGFDVIQTPKTCGN
jgi:hypothetical protein